MNGYPSPEAARSVCAECNGRQEGQTQLERITGTVKRSATSFVRWSPVVVPSFLLVVIALRRWRTDFGWDSDDVLGSQTYLRGFVPFETRCGSHS